MPNVKIYSSRNKSKKEQQNLMRMGRILYDLMEVGPWRINIDNLGQLKEPLDFSGEENVFHRAIMPDNGENQEFIYKNISDDDVFIIWKKTQNVELDRLRPFITHMWQNRVNRLLAVIKTQGIELPQDALSNVEFNIANFSQVTKIKNSLPYMPERYGFCFRAANELMDLREDWTDGGSQSNPTKFIPYKLNIKVSDLPGVKEYLAAKNNPEAKNLLAQPDYKKLLLEADNMRSRLKVYPETILTDSNQGHWDLHWPADATEAEKWYEPLEVPGNFRARNPKNDISERDVAIDFGTTGTVAAVFNSQNQPTLLRIGAQEKELRDNIKPEHYVNPTVISIENYEKLLEDWHDLPYRPQTSWNDIQCSHQAMNELKDKVASGLAGIKTWARGKSGDTPVLLADARGNEVPLPVPAPESAADITEDFASLPLNPIELYAFFLGLSLNNQVVDGGRIYTRYYLTFPAKFDKDTRKRILDGFRRGLLRSLPPSLVFGGEWSPAELTVEEWGSEPAAYAAAILPLLNANEESCATDKHDKILPVSQGENKIDSTIIINAKNEIISLAKLEQI